MTEQEPGPKPHDPTLSLRTSPEVRQALEAYAVAEGLTRSRAARTILNDWLRTHGWMENDGQKPTGPATDAVHAMDGAIAENRRSKRSSLSQKRIA